MIVNSMKSQVSNSADTLALRYQRALQGFLGGAGESALQTAYDLGRQAMREGLGALELARIHKDALMAAIEELDSKEQNTELVSKASTFFVESLATFEMTHRGFQEALAILSTRTAELEGINKVLESEVAERKRVQEALKSSELRHRSLVEKALDVIYTLSTEGTITSLNPAFERLTGWPVEEWLHKPFLPIVHPQDAGRCMQIYDTLLHGVIPSVFELQILSKSGEFLVAEFTTTPQWHDGEVVGVLGVARDITKRRRAEEQLRTSQLQLAEAQQIAHLGNWEWDVKDGSLSWSRELYNIFGVHPDNFSPTFDSFLGLVHPDDRGKVQAVIDQALEDKKPFSYDHRLVRPDGTMRISNSRGIVVTDRRGNALKMVGTGQDVTEAKQAEEALRDLPHRILNAQEIERRRLARELHDDVCQRLSGMKLGIDMIENDLPHDDRILSKIEMAKSQIDHIITDIRRISWNLRPTTLDDLGLVIAVQKLCQDYRATYKVDIQFSSATSIPQHFDANVEIALYRLVQEAAMNALKHSAASRIHVELNHAADTIILKVSDNGKGFDVSNIKRERPGEGLGLMSMKERAHLLQGKFFLESRHGHGTTVTVKIPITNGNEENQDTVRR